MIRGNPPSETANERPRLTRPTGPPVSEGSGRSSDAPAKPDGDGKIKGDPKAKDTSKAEGQTPAQPPMPPDPAVVDPNQLDASLKSIVGETDYDRVTSVLMAVVLGAILGVGWLVVIYLTSEGFSGRPAPRLEIVEVFGGEGGQEDGQEDSIEEIDINDAPLDALASNAELDASELEEPSVLDTPVTALDSVLESAEAVDPSDPVDGSVVASGPRRSRVGNGGPALGFGPGGGGIPREQRWSVLYNPGQTIDSYARQLDALGIELGIVRNGRMTYVSNLSQNPPKVRDGSSLSEGRLYFLWQGQGRKGSDLVLLRRANLSVGSSPIFHFYPARVEQILARKEVEFRGLQPMEIRMTRFRLVGQGGNYTFDVVAQEPIR